MSSLIERLTLFNAKERFWLLRSALGEAPLSPSFLQALCDEADVDPPPSDSWWAMDYHLDWLACALAGEVSLGVPQEPPGEGWRLGTQEDVDLIVAWEAGDTTHVLLVEAKGVTSHSNRQVKSKVGKLRVLFGEDGQGENGQKAGAVRPHFVLASPTEPRRLTADSFPPWCLRGDGRPRWVQLHVPNNLVQPVRCDEEGQRTRTGSRWVLRHRSRGAIVED
jgi:hypothetical protein